MAVPTKGKRPHLGGRVDNRIFKEPPSGLVKDLSAMGQVQANMDMFIAMLAHKEPVDIEENAQGPVRCRHLVRAGTVELGQVPQHKGQVRQVALRGLKEKS